MEGLLIFMYIANLFAGVGMNPSRKKRPEPSPTPTKRTSKPIRGTVEDIYPF